MLWLAYFALLFAGDARPEDQVELRSGKKLAGYVLFEGEKTVRLQVGSREQEIDVADIALIRSANRTLASVLDRLQTLPAKDVSGKLDLARYCRNNALPGEADVIALLALTVDPGNEEAHTQLGHVKRQSRWFVKRDNRTLPFDELAAVQPDFRQPWKLCTTHYELTTNVALADATRAALDLERFYRAFFQLFGRELELREVVERMGVGIHADSSSYPESTGGRLAYFNAQFNLMYINAEAGLDRYALFHEGTHGLLHNTAERTRTGRGEIPGWLDEGLAEYVGCAWRGELGASAFRFGDPYAAHFSTHRDAKKPYDLGRMLTMASGDFMVNSKADLKYAQAYTLVQFCLHGEHDKYRPGFFDFLRGAYEGQASSSDFKGALAIKERDFEQAWNAHVGRDK